MSEKRVMGKSTLQKLMEEKELDKETEQELLEGQEMGHICAGKCVQQGSNMPKNKVMVNLQIFL